jgi:hypothetical protein
MRDGNETAMSADTTARCAANATRVQYSKVVSLLSAKCRKTFNEWVREKNTDRDRRTESDQLLQDTRERRLSTTGSLVVEPHLR